jgi:biopolymer transport protein ExbD
MKFTSPDRTSQRAGLPLPALLSLMFLLLMVFVLPWQLVPQGGPGERRLPRVAPPADGSVDRGLSTVQVGLRSNAQGQLTQITLGKANLGRGEAAFARLNEEIRQLVSRPGELLAANVEVEIDADYELRYEEVLRAVTACTGRVDPETNQLIRYIDKVKFAPPHQPKPL